MKIGRGNRSTRRKPARAPLCPPKIPLDQTVARTRAAAVRSQRLTAWAMALPYWSSPSSEANSRAHPLWKLQTSYEPESSLPCSEESATGPYPESDEPGPYPCPISPRSILILLFNLRLGLTSAFFPSSFSTETLYASLFYPMHTTCPACIVLLDLENEIGIVRCVICVYALKYAQTYRKLSSESAKGLERYTVKLQLTSWTNWLFDSRGCSCWNLHVALSNIHII
jgi:hypothetical protein